MKTCNILINDRYCCRLQAAFDRSVSKDMLFSEGTLKLFAGSRAEQLAMDAGSGYSNPDLDLMLILKFIGRFGVDPTVDIMNGTVDPAFCMVKVNRSELNSAMYPFLYQWRGFEYLSALPKRTRCQQRAAGSLELLSAERFREKSMEIAAQNRLVHRKWDTLETHGPACKATVTGHGEMDIIMCIASSQPFFEMDTFNRRPRSAAWLEVVPLNRLRALDGILVPVCPRGSEGTDRELLFRKSFSTQEFILISSLPHWCRQAAVVFKHTVLRKLQTITTFPEDDPKICSYHLKTIFLWTVEAMSTEMWEMASPARLLVQLFHRLICWLEDRRIDNYWIPASNLLRFHLEDYLTECRRIVNITKDTIIASVLAAPERPIASFSGLGDIVKNPKTGQNFSLGRKFHRDIPEKVTWQLMANLLLESSGSPQYLKQVGDMAFGLETLWKHNSGEEADDKQGFAMGLFIAGILIKETDGSDGELLATYIRTAI